MKALDMSFSAGNVDIGWCRARIAEGYELLVCDLWTGNRAIPEAARALELWAMAGGRVAGYYVVHDSTPVAIHFQAARDAAGAMWPRLSFVAVDAEVVPTSSATVRAGVNLVKRDGLKAMVYTRLGFWRDAMGNPQDMADVPLWDARYGIAPSLSVPGYGGWQVRTAHQYQNTTRIAGIDVDLSVFDDNFIESDVQRDWQTMIDVTNGWAQTMAQGAKELADVRDMLIRMRPPV